jgi:hypothetical protein
MEKELEKKSNGLSIAGIFLILAGSMLILSKLHFMSYSWKFIFWACFGVLGFVMAVQGFITRRRGRVFWGSLFFFAAIALLMHRMDAVRMAPMDFPAIVSLAAGLAFLVLFVFDPRRFGVLIPALILGGYGILYYLWWWDIVDLFDVKYYLRTYWPVLVIIWGMALVFKPRNSS